jgi:hypothetical protein
MADADEQLQEAATVEPDECSRQAMISLLVSAGVALVSGSGLLF